MVKRSQTPDSSSALFFFQPRRSPRATKSRKGLHSSAIMSTPSSGTPSSYLPINTTSLTAPTPQNTPLNTAPITSQLSRPTVPDISEDDDEDEQDPTKSAAAKQAILGMVQGKLATLVGKSSGYIESLPVSVKRRVEGLKGVQGDYAKIEREYKLEMIALDRKVSIPIDGSPSLGGTINLIARLAVSWSLQPSLQTKTRYPQWRGRTNS
jgi:hypothetical protein